MIAPDSRPIHDVIADLLLPEVAEHCTCQMFSNDGHRVNPPCSTVRRARRLAAAVVAACQQATVEQQAELTGGEVETGNYRVEPHHDTHPFCVPRSCTHTELFHHDVRAVGPWREDPS